MNRVSKSTGKTEYFAFALAAVLAVVLIFAAGCVPQVDDPPYEINTVFPSSFEGAASGKKIYATSVGQSYDLATLSVYMDGVGLTYDRDSLLTADRVETGSVVFLVVGCSVKAMAEFDVTKETELRRAEAFVSRAAKGEITVIAWHIGGVARRGSVSDSLIKYVFQNVQLALFTADGNILEADDSRSLSDWAVEADVPYCQMSGNIPEILQKLAGRESKYD